MCRSPFAAALAEAYAAEIGASLSVTSASIDAEERRVHPTIVQLLAERNVPLDPTTTSTALSAALVDQAHVVLTMTGEHAISVARRFRGSTAKVFMLDHFAQLVANNDTSLDQFLVAMWTQPRTYPHHPTAVDIPDPIGRDDATFRGVADQIDALVRHIVSQLHTYAQI